MVRLTDSGNILQSNKKTCAIQPTGSGKSFLILKLIEDYAEQNRDIIVIEPQKYIFEQLQKKMKKYGLANNNVKFLTYSALGKLNDEKIQEYQFPKLVIVDEMHRAGAPKWGSGLQNMLDSFPKDCKYIGFSATPIRFLDGKRNMAEELFDGCIANEIGLADAILNRILPLPRYIAGLYTYENEVNAITKKIQSSNNADEEKEKLLEEVAVMKKNLDKSKGISSIFKKYINQDKGKYIAFCRNIIHLKQMKLCLLEWFSEAGISVNLYEVHCKNPENDKQFKEFMADDRLAVCLSVAMLAEGVHGIDGVILLRDTISPNLYYQQIGRAFSVDMDTVPIIFDLVANCESIINCNLKNNLLNAIDKRSNYFGIIEDRDSNGIEITKEYIGNFFVFDQVIDAVNKFKGIEDKLYVSWDEMYQEYCKFYEENGHGDVPSGNGYGKLYEWCYQQRKDLGNKVLKADRKELLDRKGFIWSIHKYRFLCSVKDVKCFLKEKGEYPKHGDIFNGKKLGLFVDSERKYRKDLEYKSKIYPQWKSEIIKGLGLYDFFCEERQISDLVIDKSFRYVTSIEGKAKRIS